MCGRLVQSSPLELVRATFRATGLETEPAPAPRYNVAPSQDVLAVVGAPDGRRIGRLRWGLVGAREKDPKASRRPINLRSETVAARPPLRELLARRRCVVPADGFYEWSGEGPARRPWHLRERSGGLLAFAGLWDRWTGAEGTDLLTVAILTGPPNDLVRAIHDRMPVILDGETLERWLDPGARDPAALAAELRPFPAERLEAFPVSRDVNSPRNDAPSLVRPEGTLRLTPLRSPAS